MRYSSPIGVLAAIAVLVASFMPWVEIQSAHIVLSGMNAQGTNFGRPGQLHILLSAIALLMFCIPRIWAKRVNWFVCAFALAWGLRNFIIYARCEMDTCPIRKFGLYLILIGSIVMLLAAFFPNLKIPQESPDQSKS
jgi:hypothetical protein